MACPHPRIIAQTQYCIYVSDPDASSTKAGSQLEDGSFSSAGASLGLALRAGSPFSYMLKAGASCHPL